MKIKNLLIWLPEIYIFASVILYWTMTTLLNPIAILLAAVLGIFLWLKNRALGISIAAVFFLLNLYMVLAMISELNEFSTFNMRAFELLAGGSLYFGLNIFVSVRMLIKWTKKGLTVSM